MVATVKAKASKKKSAPPAPHPWTEISLQTSFDFPALEVLSEHHRVLSGFCWEPSIASDSSTSARPITPSPESAHTPSSSHLQLSFAQYCVSLSALILYGSSTQQFEYLFHAYAVESERGITRAEVFQLLQDHCYKRLEPSDLHSKPRLPSTKPEEADADARHFERLYTWLKKHVAIYDRARCGFLPLKTALEMLHAHPSALQHVQLQIDALVRKMRENNAKYREKTAAAQIQEQ